MYKSPMVDRKPATRPARQELGELYAGVRAATLRLLEPLSPEDAVVQTMPDVSPTKWHLAHTTWFFEAFVLKRALPTYRAIDERYGYLFNSYYNAVGEQFPRHRRGLLSRPTLKEVVAYREHVDRSMQRVLGDAPDALFEDVRFTLEVGLNHEEQHQELILTDIKHVLSTNPLEPPYREASPSAPGRAIALGWLQNQGGVVEIGHGGDDFAFDNEKPLHPEYLSPFSLANRLVTAGEYLEFVEDRGYERPTLWLSDGWALCKREGWRAPLYWGKTDGEYILATLAGKRALDPREPVCHVSFYEADAFATWAGARLPRESEWEIVARTAGAQGPGNYVESGALHPRALSSEPSADGAAQLFGDVWEWTTSPYVAYPGYRPFEGALGEYNGKFMCNQLVLRGGSCFTPRRHMRSTYRNFFPPEARWQMSGIRLAR